MDKNIIDSCAHDSYAGTASFGEIVMRLAGAGVESYYADYRARTTTYYGAEGDSYTIPLTRSAAAIPPDFDAAGVQDAIRGAQRGDVKYPAFVSLSVAAGCVGYMVWIAGRHVAYYGRAGEMHVEKFPPQ